MKKLLVTSALYTLVTAVMLGVLYPLAITGIAQLCMREKANGQLIFNDGQIIGSNIIGQPFSGPGFFHSRPSAAGAGYDASASSGSNLGPTNKGLITRINGAVSVEGAGAPIDLVTTSASGLDPDISPAAALFQVPRVAQERHLSEGTVRHVVLDHIQQRQFGLLGEPRVNVWKLNRSLAGMRPTRPEASSGGVNTGDPNP